MANLYRDAQKGAHGVKVTGGGQIRLYRIVQGMIALPGPDAPGKGDGTVDAAALAAFASIAAVILGVGFHAELPHHFNGHFDIGSAVKAFRLYGKVFL